MDRSQQTPEVDVDALLTRAPTQRLREYKYRCAQAIVFGLPVLALQWFGASLGGPEAPRWVALLQALLAGWVIYVGAAGMLLEGAILLERRRLSGDFIIALVAIVLYIVSLVAAGSIVFADRGVEPFFHVPVLIVAVWTGVRWAVSLYFVRQLSLSGE